MGFQDIVRHLKNIMIGALQTGSNTADAVAVADKDLRLVKCNKVCYAVRKTLCYDLACPICDRASRRLTLTAGGYARCAKCLVTYDMNSYGAIYKIPQDTTLNKPRGLYRYRVNYNGQILNAYN